MSWFEVADGAPFGTAELPYGIFSVAGAPPRVGVAVGDRVIDLAGLTRAVGLDHLDFDTPTLNAFLARGPAVWQATRDLLGSLLDEPSGASAVTPHLVPADRVRMHLPFAVADYVDFYASEHHATNVGRIFRPDGEPLTPNWRHLPIGYHGRAGTVVVSGSDIPRPSGQRKAPADPGPTFGASTKLDIEAEVGWVVGVGSERGTPVSTGQFADHVFGVVIVNDWSARDLQAWEYVPLGPFLGKSFATSVSAWVLPLAALAGAATDLPPRDRPLLPYLAEPPSRGYDITVEVELNGSVIARCPYAAMAYSPAQMLAHLTANGASLRTGDLFASGTISGPEPDQRGSLLELTWNGTVPLRLGPETRAYGFLADGDEVVMRGSAPGPGADRVSLGEVRGRIVASALVAG